MRAINLTSFECLTEMHVNRQTPSARGKGKILCFQYVIPVEWFHKLGAIVFAFLL